MTDPDSMSETHAGLDETFRLPPIHRRMAVGFLIVFLIWAGLDLYVACSDPKIPHPVGFGILAVGVPLGMAGLSAWLIALSGRFALIIRGNRVTARGVLGERSVDLGEVEKARWRWAPAGGGSVLLRASSTRLAIDLSVYDRDDRIRIVRHFRDLLPPEAQEGWNLYAHKTRFFEPRPDVANPGPGEVVLRRDRWDRYFVPGLMVSGLLGGFLWWTTGDPMRFVASLLIVPLLWLPLRFATPAEGMVTHQLSGSINPDAIGFLWFVPAWLLVALAGLIAHERYKSEIAYPMTTLAVGSVAWLAVLVDQAVRVDRRMARRDRKAADKAAKARGEPPEGGFPGDLGDF